MRYFVHPESECVWTQHDDEPMPDDGLTHEIDEDKYYELIKQGFACPIDRSN